MYVPKSGRSGVSSDSNLIKPAWYVAIVGDGFGVGVNVFGEKGEESA